MNYTEAKALLDTARNKRAGKPIANNTRLQARDDGAIALVLHSTAVLTFNPDGRIEIDTGDWHTVTTKDRINRHLPRPWGVYSVRRRRTEWWLWNGHYPILPLGDGMTVTADGAIEIDGAELMSADDIAAERARQDAAAEAKAKRPPIDRPAMLARQHARGADGAFGETWDGKPLFHPRGFGGSWNGYAWDCPTCHPREERAS
jgi:hypothetical protein